MSGDTTAYIFCEGADIFPEEGTDIDQSLLLAPSKSSKNAAFAANIRAAKSLSVGTGAVDAGEVGAGEVDAGEVIAGAVIAGEVVAAAVVNTNELNGPSILSQIYARAQYHNKYIQPGARASTASWRL